MSVRLQEIVGSYGDSSLTLRLATRTQNILQTRPEAEKIHLATTLERLLFNFCRASNKIASLTPKQAENYTDVVTTALSEATRTLG